MTEKKVYRVTIARTQFDFEFVLAESHVEAARLALDPNLERDWDQEQGTDVIESEVVNPDAVGTYGIWTGEKFVDAEELNIR